MNKKSRKIRVLVVEDSPTARAFLTRLINSDPDFEVVGVAEDGFSAVSMNRRLEPDVITMDLHMEGMDGLNATRQILQESSVPILVVTKSVGASMEIVFRILGEGALDVIRTPRPEEGMERGKEEILRKIRIISGLKSKVAQGKAVKATIREPQKAVARPASSAIVAIGASTGGPSALVRLLGELDGNFPFPILVSQHMEADFLEEFVRWLDDICKIEVQLAKAGEMPQPGKVLVSPGHRHFELGESKRILLPLRGTDDIFCPSVDKMFQSVADVYGNAAVGILLTGMGSDGAKGLLKMKQKGALTLAQDEQSSVVYGMPRVALEIGAVSKGTPLDEIASVLMSWSMRRSKAPS